MAGKPKSDQKGPGAEKQRGTSDDMEVLMLILKDHQGIRLRVEDKIRREKNRILKEREQQNRG